MIDLFPTFLGNIEKCPFTYWLNGRWFPQIVEEDSGNLYPIYIFKEIVVLASEPVGGRSRATELPCIISLNEVFGDIMVLASPPRPPPVDPDDVNTLTHKIFNLSLSNFICG